MNLQQQLAQLDMWSEMGTTGLLWTRELDGLPADERLIVEDALRYEADAVYIRRFSSGKTAEPQVYLYDVEDQFHKTGLTDLRKRLWNFGQVPLMMVFTRNEVKIFNCYHSPFDKKGDVISKPFEIIQLASQAQKFLDLRKAFSGKKLDNGSFWDSPYGKKIKREDSAYVQLLTQLKDVRKNLVKAGILSQELTERLLILSIMVKYLEDRRDQDGNGVFPNGFFARFAPDAESYQELLSARGACVKLFNYLSEYFNGKFFEITPEEQTAFSQADLSAFAEIFISGRVAGRQYQLWQHYSFEDLPVELISNIYEEFLDKEHAKKKGAVYTPPYLVDLLIDECMPIQEPRQRFKVLDPACGSGVFLVSAYKRLIIWWRQLHDWQRPGKEHLPALKQLLRENIFGVDVEKSAAQLAMFSLTLTLCDELSPKEIWEELKFDNLQDKNLFHADFFNLLLEKKLPRDFDLVIGNPPFVSELSEPARQIDSRSRTDSGRPAVPDKQLALLFLEQAPTIVKPETGKVCLIIKSGPLLYNAGSLAFRRHVFTRYQVDYIFDFTPLEAVLFHGAQVETAAIFLTNQQPQQDELYHITFRRTQASREQVYFDLDAYDIHPVRYEDALNQRLVWKANLLGGGRLHHLLLRVEGVRTLGNFLEEKTGRAENSWYAGEGFIVGNETEIDRLIFLKGKESLNEGEISELKKLTKKFKKANHLTGFSSLPTEAFDHDGIKDEMIFKLEDVYFYRSSSTNEKIFSPPHLLIKEHVKEEAIPVAYREDYLTFRHQIIGIHAPWEEKEKLRQIEGRLKGSKNYAFWAACMSPKYLIDRASALLKYDLDHLPYPEDESDLEVGELEQILIDDVLDYHVNFRRKGENAESVQPVNNTLLHQFGEIYTEVLNSVYGQFSPHTPICLPAFVIYPFYYGDQPQVEIPDESQIEAHLENLIRYQPQKSLRINRILRIYDQNIIYLIKPDQMRYWLRSVAIRDADETFADLVTQGY
ncbi:MAG: N-6 DNA methylase [Bacteroidia bacterium]|nr:N-6 DNA methylase [Bacteroidia bacterium]